MLAGGLDGLANPAVEAHAVPGRPERDPIQLHGCCASGLNHGSGAGTGGSRFVASAPAAVRNCSTACLAPASSWAPRRERHYGEPGDLEVVQKRGERIGLRGG